MYKVNCGKKNLMVSVQLPDGGEGHCRTGYTEIFLYLEFFARDELQCRLKFTIHDEDRSGVAILCPFVDGDVPLIGGASHLAHARHGHGHGHSDPYRKLSHRDLPDFLTEEA